MTIPPEILYAVIATLVAAVTGLFKMYVDARNRETTTMREVLLVSHKITDLVDQICEVCPFPKGETDVLPPPKERSERAGTSGE